MEKINCANCKNMVLDHFSGVHSCPLLNCGCHPEKSNFLLKVGEVVPRWLPELGEDKCPGMAAITVQTID